jgi:hypothetical protein
MKMKRRILVVLSSALLAGMGFAQAASQTGSSAEPQSSNTAPPSAAAPAPVGTNANLATTPLQSGSIIYAELAKSIDARKVKVGDEVQARTTQAALSQGKVVIPKGSKIMGHVTQVTQRSSDQKSQLGFNFDHAVLKDGTQVPLSVSVQALGGGPTAASAFDQSASNMGGNRGMPSAGMPGRTAASEGGGYGAPGGAVGGMGAPGASTGPSTGGMTPGDTSPNAVHLNAGSKGVIGLSGLSMSSSTAQGTVIISDKKNVKLDSGIELVLRSN